MSVLDMPLRKTIYLFPETRVDNWTGVVEIVVETKPTDRMKQIIHEALSKHHVPIKAATPEIQFYIDSFLTGANL